MAVEVTADDLAAAAAAVFDGGRMLRGVVRFVHAVRLWDVTYERTGQVTEARAEDFEIVIDWRGQVVEVMGHGSRVLVPFANVKSIDVSEALP